MCSSSLRGLETYGVKGILTFTVDGTAYEVCPGESRVVPRGVEHHFINLHDETARCLTVQTHGSIGPEYYREVAAIVNAGGPPDPVKVKEAMGRHGVIAVPPKRV